MTVNKIEMQDSSGNVLYPHTSGDLIQYNDNMSVVQKIDEAMTNLVSLKAGLATAVNNKTGSSLTSDSTIQEIANEVNSIVTLSSGTNDATATASQILSGSTAYVKGNKITGSMANNGTVTQTLNAGGSYTIPAGYHNGSGKVTANSLASQTQATAVAGDMISGKTAYVNGSKIIGNIASKTATTYTPSTSNQIIPAGNYLSGDQTIKGDTNLVGGNIISGKTIFGVAGTATVQSMGGVKIVTGQVTSSSTKDRSFTMYQLSGSTMSLASLNVTGLPFRPKYAMFYATDYYGWRSVCTIDTTTIIGDKVGGMFTATSGSNVTASGCNAPYQDNTWMITDNSVIGGTTMTSTSFYYVIFG